MKAMTSSARATFWLAGLLVALAAALFMTGALTAQELAPESEPTFRGPSPADLDGEVRVDRAYVEPGGTLNYTLIIANRGDSSLDAIEARNTLPAGLTYVDGSIAAPEGTHWQIAGNVLTWSGPAFARSQVEITFKARVDTALSIGSDVVNVLTIAAAGQQVQRMGVTAVVAEGGDGALLPVIQKPVATVTLVAGRPTNSNTWTLSWTDAGPGIINYELHESKDPNFGTFTVVNAGTNTSVQRSHPPSFRPFYYYRVRAIGPFGAGAWSNVVTVLGNYRDDFQDSASDWRIRRMSYLEGTFGYYLDGSFVMLIDDRWDWAAASPLVPAPPIPYEIEYRSKNHNVTANLVSGGALFGADWNGDTCPEVGNVYQTDNCLNHFYNFNYIFFGPIKLLHEQVNELVWCPSCGGSALKRIGPTQDVGDVIPSSTAGDWHTYRIEVRADGARLFIDGNFIRHFTDTSFINDPYFGVFASTDEYKPSIWFFDWFAVRHLD